MAGPNPQDLTSLDPPESVARRTRQRRVWAVPLSLAGHGLALLILILTYTDRAKPVEDGPVTTASLVEGVQLADSTPSPGPPQPRPQAQQTRQVETKSQVHPTRAPPEDAPLEADEKPAPQPTEAQLASAATADSGGGGGGGLGAGGGGRECNMARLLQNALRKDRSVQAAVGDVHRATGKALLVWNGDWVKSTGQDGKGLAILREAIAWEVGFAPPACRSQPVHGLVLISLSDSPGGPRLVLGQDRWRWSDVLGLRNQD